MIGQALQDLVHPQDFNEMAHIFTGERPVKPGKMGDTHLNLPHCGFMSSALLFPF